MTNFDVWNFQIKIKTDETFPETVWVSLKLTNLNIYFLVLKYLQFTLIIPSRITTGTIPSEAECS